MLRRLFLIALTGFALVSCSDNADESYVDPNPDLTARLYAGGETTIFSATSISFRTPAPNLSASDLQAHIVGDALFENVYVTAPADINPGLGPIFNNSSCISCHPNDGRTGFPLSLLGRSGLLVRSSMPGTATNGGPIPAPGFGLQVQNQAIFGYNPEAQYANTFTDVVETLSDGTVVHLRKPNITLINPYTGLPSGMLLSPRMATPVFGLGLLEVIPEANILARQDINDTNGDGISGKANYVWDSHTNQTVLGRFGWKANTGSLIVQCAAAFVEDMGITNMIFQEESGRDQPNGSDGLGDDPEVTQALLDNIVLYCRTLGVPAPRNVQSTNVRQGAALFEQIDCAKCHIPKQKTGTSAISALSNQTIYPYSDMLLHDMGEGLADNRPDFLANGQEWKTRPLWGIGLTNLVNGHTEFLHDGRARNIEEAILWHGGEAQRAKNKYKALTAQQRKDLLAFINSL